MNLENNKSAEPGNPEKMSVAFGTDAITQQNFTRRNFIEILAIIALVSYILAQGTNVIRLMLIFNEEGMPPLGYLFHAKFPIFFLVIAILTLKNIILNKVGLVLLVLTFIAIPAYGLFIDFQNFLLNTTQPYFLFERLSAESIMFIVVKYALIAGIPLMIQFLQAARLDAH